MTRTHLLPLLVFASACGFTSPGGGTRTLYVSARLTSDGSTSGSRARIVVRQGSSSGEVVPDAEVALRGGALTRTVLPFDPARSDYRLDGFQWVEGFRLEVLRGTDLLDGAIDAPGETLIVNPISGSTFRRADNLPLIVQWKDARGSVASITKLELDKAKVDRAIAQGVLAERVEAADLEVGGEKVKVTRSNEVGLAGGAAGSLLSATTDHEVEFKVE